MTVSPHRYFSSGLEAGQPQHPFSIVSLNWDCILDNALHGHIAKGLSPSVGIDYCCYTNPLENSASHIPSVMQKSMGVFNVKIMKLHGSTNWFLCPNCHRLYVGLGSTEHTWTSHLKGAPCPRCDYIRSHSQSPEAHAPDLEPFFVTPTFLKRFENPHIRMVWHNAYLDLCEASKVVFVGYSFPKADYQVRTLLKRAVRTEAKVEVVLCDRDRPSKKKDRDGSAQSTVDRYREFFESCAGVSFNYTGVKGYFEGVFGSEPLATRISSLRKTFQAIRKQRRIGQVLNPRAPSACLGPSDTHINKTLKTFQRSHIFKSIVILTKVHHSFIRNISFS